MSEGSTSVFHRGDAEKYLDDEVGYRTSFR